MLKVFVINGFPGSGKDTFVELVAEIMKSRGLGYVRNYHSSDMVKGVFKHLGWDGKKTPEIRNFMAEVIEGSNNLFDTAFKEALRLYVALEKEGTQGILFIHERKPVNIARLCNTFKAKSILIERGTPEFTEDLPTNKADREVLDYTYRIHIDNNGSLGDLRIKAVTFIKEEIG